MRDTELSKEALARVLQDRKPDLIITVDNGIAAAQEVAWLLQQEIDVVVTDHHEPADLVPQGVPVTDPSLLRIALPENLLVRVLLLSWFRF